MRVLVRVLVARPVRKVLVLVARPLARVRVAVLVALARLRVHRGLLVVPVRPRAQLVRPVLPGRCLALARVPVALVPVWRNNLAA